MLRFKKLSFGSSAIPIAFVEPAVRSARRISVCASPAAMRDDFRNIDIERSDIDGRYAWMRLAVSVLIGAIGGVGMWAVIVVLPAVQAEFGVD
ncbi:MAG: hypothetical protein ACTHJV_08250, partial [Rhizobiaceae bacterium]